MNLEISITCHYCTTVIASGHLTTQACPHLREVRGGPSLVHDTGLSVQRGGNQQPQPEPHQVSRAGVAACTVEQVADMLSIGWDKVCYLLRTGQLKSLKIGKLRRITNAHLAEFLASAEDTHRREGHSGASGSSTFVLWFRGSVPWWRSSSWVRENPASAGRGPVSRGLRKAPG